MVAFRSEERATHAVRKGEGVVSFRSEERATHAVGEITFTRRVAKATSFVEVRRTVGKSANDATNFSGEIEISVIGFIVRMVEVEVFNRADNNAMAKISPARDAFGATLVGLVEDRRVFERRAKKATTLSSEIEIRLVNFVVQIIKVVKEATRPKERAINATTKSTITRRAAEPTWVGLTQVRRATEAAKMEIRLIEFTMEKVGVARRVTERNTEAAVVVVSEVEFRVVEYEVSVIEVAVRGVSKAEVGVTEAAIVIASDVESKLSQVEIAIRDKEKVTEAAIMIVSKVEIRLVESIVNAVEIMVREAVRSVERMIGRVIASEIVSRFIGFVEVSVVENTVASLSRVVEALTSSLIESSV